MNATARVTRRPAGATVLALVLGWLAVAGFRNAIVWRSASTALSQQTPPRVVAMMEAFQSPTLTLLALAYGITALTASIGIWRMRSWMTSAFLAWAAVVTVLFAWMMTIIPTELLLGRLLGAILFGSGIIALLYLGFRYLRRLASGIDRAAL